MEFIPMHKPLISLVWKFILTDVSGLQSQKMQKIGTVGCDLRPKILFLETRHGSIQPHVTSDRYDYPYPFISGCDRARC
jgi:hypothetical protein